LGAGAIIMEDGVARSREAGARMVAATWQKKHGELAEGRKKQARAR